MIEVQRNLFRMPRIAHGRITPKQVAVLDWVAFNDGRVALFPERLSKAALRSVIAKGLVVPIDRSPARYQLTHVGSMVRSRRP